MSRQAPADGPQMVALAEQWMEPGKGCWKRIETSLASHRLDGEDDEVEGWYLGVSELLAQDGLG